VDGLADEVGAIHSKRVVDVLKHELWSASIGGDPVGLYQGNAVP